MIFFISFNNGHLRMKDKLDVYYSSWRLFKITKTDKCLLFNVIIKMQIFKALKNS